MQLWPLCVTSQGTQEWHFPHSLQLCLHRNKQPSMGGRHSSVVSSAPTILRPWVRIPCTPFTLFSICIIEIAMRKITKINKKRPGLAHFKKQPSINQRWWCCCKLASMLIKVRQKIIYSKNITTNCSSFGWHLWQVISNLLFSRPTLILPCRVVVYKKTQIFPNALISKFFLLTSWPQRAETEFEIRSF